MNRCLVTKLDGGSNNLELRRLGEMRIKIAERNDSTTDRVGFAINANKPVTLEIIGNGFFVNKENTVNKGKTVGSGDIVRG